MISERIENISVQGYSEISFIIGGTLGLSKEVINASNELISFSKGGSYEKTYSVALFGFCRGLFGADAEA